MIINSFSPSLFTTFISGIFFMITLPTHGHSSSHDAEAVWNQTQSSPCGSSLNGDDSEKTRVFLNSVLEKTAGMSLKESDRFEQVAGGFSKADLYMVTLAAEDGATSRDVNRQIIVKHMKESPADDVEVEAEATEKAGLSGVGPISIGHDSDRKVIVREAVDNVHTIDRHDTPFHKLVAEKVRAFHNVDALCRDTLFFDILREDAKRVTDNHLYSTFSSSHDETQFQEMAKQIEHIFSHFKDDIRPVHHDLSPHNILYDGENAWLIDWETATNDYYSIDLCMFANFHIYDETKLPEFLKTYYGREPTEIEWAKFHAIRPFCYAFHGFRLAFLAKQSKNEALQPDISNLPEYKDFQLGIRKGTIPLGSPESLYRLGVATMNKAVSMLKGEDFTKSLVLLESHIQNQKGE